jgi:hypothetical protein
VSSLGVKQFTQQSLDVSLCPPTHDEGLADAFVPLIPLTCPAWPRSLVVPVKEEDIDEDHICSDRCGRLWADRGWRAEAGDLLAPVYGWCTEGFDSVDLTYAKACSTSLPEDVGSWLGPALQRLAFARPNYGSNRTFGGVSTAVGRRADLLRAGLDRPLVTPAV